MKLAKMFLAVTLVLAFSGPFSWGQTAPSAANSGPDAGQSVTHSYRLTYTFTETDGGKRVGTQHFAMIVVNGRKTVLKQGSRVPIATGASSVSGSPQTQFQYMDVGLKIEASLDVDGARLETKVEQSSLAEEKSGAVTLNDPIVRNTQLEGTSILVPGKSMMLGSIDIPGTSRHQDIDVVMEPVVQ